MPNNLLRQVTYKDDSFKLVRNPADFPDLEERSFKVAKLQEPMVIATLIFPDVSFFIYISVHCRHISYWFLTDLGIYGKID